MGNEQPMQETKQATPMRMPVAMLMLMGMALLMGMAILMLMAMPVGRRLVVVFPVDLFAGACHAAPFPAAAVVEAEGVW